jgi:hypothetical protein
MKILKKILIVAACIIALPLIVAIFVPRTYTVSVSETIGRPKEKVFDFVRMLSNQSKYNVWMMPDPNVKLELVGTDGTEGVVQKWDSQVEEVGAGEQRITALTPERMDLEINILRPFAGKLKVANLFKSKDGNSTVLTSEFYSDASWPMNLPAYFFGRKVIEEAEAKNLKNIKTLLEAGE